MHSTSVAGLTTSPGAAEGSGVEKAYAGDGYGKLVGDDWNMTCIFHKLGMSSSQLRNSYFSEHQPVNHAE